MKNKKQYVIPELFLSLMTVQDVLLASDRTFSDNGDNITRDTWGGNW